jgi:outer membrane protein
MIFRRTGRLILILSALLPATSQAALTLDEAIELALASDPRIEETRRLVDVARATLEEAEASNGLMVSINAFLGLAPEYSGGFFTEGNRCTSLPCSVNRDDSIDSIGLWAGLQLQIIKPLYTFGKIEHYSRAAEGQVAVREGDVSIRRADTRLEVTRAWNGFLAARDTRMLLEDMVKRARKAIKLVERWLDEGDGRAKLSDLFALQTGESILAKYLNQSRAVEAIAHDGLRLLIDLPAERPLDLAEDHIRANEMPNDSLNSLQQRALELRPEIGQLEAGLEARRALVRAKQADLWPNIYTGVVGSFATSSRKELNSPWISDTFDHAGITPVLGVNWSWSGGVQSARIAREEAEVAALVEKATFARRGIPFQVAEQYHTARHLRDSVERLSEGSRAGRRWLLATYTDFEAGLESANKLAQAFQGYVLAHTDFISTINDYNMALARLAHTIGEMQQP